MGCPGGVGQGAGIPLGTGVKRPLGGRMGKLALRGEVKLDGVILHEHRNKPPRLDHLLSSPLLHI